LETCLVYDVRKILKISSKNQRHTVINGTIYMFLNLKSSFILIFHDRAKKIQKISHNVICTNLNLISQMIFPAKFCSSWLSSFAGGKLTCEKFNADGQRTQNQLITLFCESLFSTHHLYNDFQIIFSILFSENLFFTHLLSDCALCLVPWCSVNCPLLRGFEINYLIKEMSVS
jgi:hypothetical protein